MFQFVKATVYSMRSGAGWFGVVGLCAALMACDGQSPSGSSIGPGGSSNGGASASGGAPGTGGTDGSIGGSPNPSAGGTTGTFLPPDDGTGGSQGCRLADSCEESECGPIADGCGDFIACGNCEAPATCGGAGVPSRCGVPGTDGTGTCTPATCESLGMECGTHGNGCGQVVTCPTCAGVGEECVQGQCQETTSCVRLTCADYPVTAGRCGQVTDGCSGMLDCDFPALCPDGQRCGAQQPGFCGVVTCTPWTCEEGLAGKPVGYCGFVSNGCDGELTGCATECGIGEECGTDVDGEYTLVCGPSGSSGGCTPSDETTACQNKCGVLSDGCNDTHDCGGCGSNEICGANNNPNVCGAAACVPTTCDDQFAECGEIENGCGQLLDCGDCDPGDTCAGDGVPFECGSPQCEPYTEEEACTDAGVNCGPQTDGCSGTVDCGGCPNGETCGGGGTPSQCGTSCTPLTCQAIGATCGPQSNGCGGQIDCSSCGVGFVCQGTPSTCVPDLCTNLCRDRATCSANNQTSISGTVYAPNGTEPLYNALVYVPNLANLANLPAISAGPTCERCEDENLGEPLVAAVTGPDGAFTLRDVPAGVEFPLVVKMGKWRRVTMIPAVDACSSNVLAADDARLPRHMNDAEQGLEQHVNIPKFALTTGRVDAIECVMRKVGIADSEFTAPTGSGRIHLYRGQGSGNPAYPGAGTSRTNGAVTGTADTALFSGNTINGYDVAIFDCEGKEIGRNTTRENTLRSFANAGGRVFASHYSYTYLNEKDPGQASTSDNNRFADTATWGGSQSTEANAHNPTTGIIDLTHDKGQAFDSWLDDVNALHPTYGDGYINIIDPRGYVRAVNASTTERFVYTDANHLVPGYSGQGAQPNGDINVQSAVQQYSFNTPVGTPANEACGRVLYSAFHVAGTNLDTSNSVFPEHCNSDPLTPQEKILEFMIFDLSACVSTTVPPTCAPKTCSQLGLDCGYVSDGCGGLLECGPCVAPETCGGGGTPNVCGSSCTLRTCTSAGATCGVIGDGCGGTIDCGPCTPGTTCGGGGTPNVCGAPPCTPRTCQQVGATCGDIGNGCGGTLNCGTCVPPQFCGGGGPNTCGTTTCTPTTCLAEDANCGTIGDGCGIGIDCGVCQPGSSCGAGGPNRCGPTCTPTTCSLAGKNCGYIGDGCGGVLNCGPCGEGALCGGGEPGVPNVCGGSCDPVTCQEAGAVCGTISDGCGGVKSCGTCPAGQVCGANNNANQCGAGSCTPDTCGELCGPQSNGCSGTLDCPPCGGCVPLTCVPNVDCGPIADGCGDLIDCGGCVNGNRCGGGGQASKCGGAID